MRYSGALEKELDEDVSLINDEMTRWDELHAKPEGNFFYEVMQSQLDSYQRIRGNQVAEM